MGNYWEKYLYKHADRLLWGIAEKNKAFDDFSTEQH